MVGCRQNETATPLVARLEAAGSGDLSAAHYKFDPSVAARRTGAFDEEGLSTNYGFCGKTRELGGHD